MTQERITVSRWRVRIHDWECRRTPRRGGRKATYAYDGLYRLTGETVTENGTTSVKTYAYDAAGDLAVVGDSIQALSGNVVL